MRKARDAAGLSIDDVSAKLKMPDRVVEAMEAEDWKRLGAPVFVRGQLRSYSRLLGLVTSTTLAASGVAPIEPTPIVARSYTPRMTRWFEQGKRRLVYIILTAALVVPAWLATKPHIMGRTDPATVQSLDAPVTGAPRWSVRSANRRRVANEPTVVASMTPNLSPRPAAKSALVLRLTGDSWVQVQAPDGRTLEKGLLSRGHPRVPTPPVKSAASRWATHRRWWCSMAIASRTWRPTSRANVARFTVSSDGSLAPVGD